MEPKEKAIELFDRYFLLSESATDENGNLNISILNKGLAKKCALIAINEMMRQNVDFKLNLLGNVKFEDFKKLDDYLTQVMIEIRKL